MTARILPFPETARVGEIETAARVLLASDPDEYRLLMTSRLRKIELRLHALGVDFRDAQREAIRFENAVRHAMATGAHARRRT